MWKEIRAVDAGTGGGGGGRGGKRRKMGCFEGMKAVVLGGKDGCYAMCGRDVGDGGGRGIARLLEAGGAVVQEAKCHPCSSRAHACDFERMPLNG
eukprot:1637125-Rhodomonas_salina.1